MSKTFRHNSLNRNANAVNAMHRTAARFDHRLTPRGGSRNDQQDFLDEMIDHDQEDFIGESYQEPADEWYSHDDI